MQSKIKPLNKVLQYENPKVIFRFSKRFNLPKYEIEILFKELLKWLWLCAINTTEHRQNKETHILGIDEPLLIIDEIWHEFILCTKDYTSFCNTNFGFYIHHEPNSDNSNYISNIDLVEFRMKQCEYIYDKLGSLYAKETLKLWYSDFLLNYNKNQIKLLSIHQF